MQRPAMLAHAMSPFLGSTIERLSPDILHMFWEEIGVDKVVRSTTLTRSLRAEFERRGCSGVMLFHFHNIPQSVVGWPERPACGLWEVST
jgi:hypothetical protein